MITYKIPPENKKEFIDKAVYMNTLLMKALAFFGVIAQSFNIVRVICFSRSGLGTLNNRIYFSLYTFCLACSVAYLIFTKISKVENRITYRVTLLCASIWVFWNTVLNVYDIYSSGEIHTMMVVTMLISFAALVVMEPVYAILNIVINYCFFSYFAKFLFGQSINFTITALLACLIYFVRFQQLCMELKNDKTIEEMNEKFGGGKFWLTKEQYELISHNAGLITFRFNLKYDNIIFSDNVQEIFGNAFEISGFQNFIEKNPFIVEESKHVIIDCLKKIYEKENYQNLEIMLPVKNNEQRWYKIQVVLQDSIQSDDIVAIGFMNDITEEKKKIFSLEKNASLDSFTGILNKASINAYGREKMKITSATKCKDMAMVIFDMDDFKYINDNFGHPCGDYVLKRVADILKDNAPKGAAVGRLGGDEFIALIEIPDDNERSITLFAENVIREIEGITWEEKDVRARCSAGIAKASSIPWATTYEELYQCADQALYEAKNGGKNRVCEYTKIL